ncbi:MAG TPA: prephenate dehydrogenase/arogenate dehydrogenase family protein [Polyangia bacterium]|nr:prephenate dehydrogenase/arogenate dehydrogenase family protein [Polyangia bacterium]
MTPRPGWNGAPVGRLAVIGVGQIGGSVALAARATGAVGEVVGYARSAETLQRAQALGIIDRAAPSAGEAARGAALVVLATPVRSLAALAAAIAPSLAAEAVVFDVGSVKAPVLRAVEPILSAAAASFVACHPVAGTERAGPEAASATLFDARPCVLCPTAVTSAAALALVTRLWRAFGCEVLTMDASVHDRVLGACSHLPHAAAYALAAAVGAADPAVQEQIGKLMTTSLRDTTRVAASNPAMWRDILLDNGGEVLPALDRLLGELGRLRAAIAAGDGDGLEKLLAAGKQSRDRLIPG